MGAGKGVVRRLPANPDLIADYIPVDVVVNGILVGAYHAATTRLLYFNNILIGKTKIKAALLWKVFRCIKLLQLFIFFLSLNLWSVIDFKA